MGREQGGNRFRCPEGADTFLAFRAGGADQRKPESQTPSAQEDGPQRGRRIVGYDAAARRRTSCDRRHGALDLRPRAVAHPAFPDPRSRLRPTVTGRVERGFQCTGAEIHRNEPEGVREGRACTDPGALGRLLGRVIDLENRATTQFGQAPGARVQARLEKDQLRIGGLADGGIDGDRAHRQDFREIPEQLIPQPRPCPVGLGVIPGPLHHHSLAQAQQTNGNRVRITTPRHPAVRDRTRLAHRDRDATGPGRHRIAAPASSAPAATASTIAKNHTG